MNDMLVSHAIFVDGRSQIGESEDFTPPPITFKTEEMLNGGMFTPSEVILAMEKMESSFTLTKYDSEIIQLVGIAEGNGVSFIAKASLKTEGELVEKPVVINMRVVIKSRDSGTWKSGETAKLKLTMSVKYYRETINGQVVTEIDPENCICIVGGTDLLASRRKNLGIT